MVSCGSGQPAPASGTGSAGDGSRAAGEVEGSEAGSLACENSDDCQSGLICVDGECMIPKLAR